MHYSGIALDNMIAKMQSQGVVQPSSSPWASPVILVPKEGWQYAVLHRLAEA